MDRLLSSTVVVGLSGFALGVLAGLYTLRLTNPPRTRTQKPASEPEPGVMSIDQMREQWSKLGSWYVANNEQHATEIYKTFLDFLQLDTATAIVEVGCGAGNGVALLLSRLGDRRCRIYASDLSDTMLEMLQRKQLACPDLDVRQADACKLPYEAEICDRYIANFCLQLVPEPDDMIREAARVLQPGGIAVFSVWGRREPLNFFDIIQEALRSVGLPQKSMRSNFHLNEPAVLRERVKAAGFRRTLYYNFTLPMPYTTPEEVVEHRLTKFPAVQAALKTADDATTRKLRDKLLALATQRMFDRQHADTFEALVIIAYK